MVDGQQVLRHGDRLIGVVVAVSRSRWSATIFSTTPRTAKDENDRRRQSSSKYFLGMTSPGFNGMFVAPDDDPRVEESTHGERETLLSYLRECIDGRTGQ